MMMMMMMMIDDDLIKDSENKSTTCYRCAPAAVKYVGHIIAAFWRPFYARFMLYSVTQN